MIKTITLLSRLLAGILFIAAAICAAATQLTLTLAVATASQVITPGQDIAFDVPAGSSGVTSVTTTGTIG